MADAPTSGRASPAAVRQGVGQRTGGTQPRGRRRAQAARDVGRVRSRAPAGGPADRPRRRHRLLARADARPHRRPGRGQGRRRDDLHPAPRRSRGLRPRLRAVLAGPRPRRSRSATSRSSRPPRRTRSPAPTPNAGDGQRRPGAQPRQSPARADAVRRVGRRQAARRDHRRARRVQPRRAHPPQGIRADEPGRAARRRTADRPAEAAPRGAPHAPPGAARPRRDPRAARDVPAQPRHGRRLRRRGSGGAARPGRDRSSSSATSAARWSASRACCCDSCRRSRGSAVRAESFVFSTRLTRVTRILRDRDRDRALAKVSEAVSDWAGGTRIGESLRTFNQKWARRVLRSGAVVVIVSDGWDRGDPAVVGREMARLQRSCHRLVWLNPLAGAPGYQPLAAGMQAAYPYIDDFLPAGTVASLERLGQVLAGGVARSAVRPAPSSRRRRAASRATPAAPPTRRSTARHAQSGRRQATRRLGHEIAAPTPPANPVGVRPRPPCSAATAIPPLTTAPLRCGSPGPSWATARRRPRDEGTDRHAARLGGRGTLRGPRRRRPDVRVRAAAGGRGPAGERRRPPGGVRVRRLRRRRRVRGDPARPTRRQRPRHPLRHQRRGGVGRRPRVRRHDRRARRAAGPTGGRGGRVRHARGPRDHHAAAAGRPARRVRRCTSRATGRRRRPTLIVHDDGRLDGTTGSGRRTTRR